MRLRSSRADDFLDRDPPADQCVSYQGAMAAPRHRLGTHHRETLPLRSFGKTLDGRAERGCLHVVRVTPERSIPPAGVWRMRTWVAKPAQGSNVFVADVRCLQRLRQCLAIELRIAPRARHGAHVDDELDVVRQEQGNEVPDGSRGVANGRCLLRSIGNIHRDCSLPSNIASSFI